MSTESSNDTSTPRQELDAEPNKKSRCSATIMVSDLAGSMFEIPGEILRKCTLVSFVFVFIVGALFSAMNTVTCFALVLALVLGLIYRFTLPKRDLNAIHAFLGPKATVFGHRAAALDAPENTMSAIRLAKKNRAYGVEIDLSFTKDNVAITFHDDDLDRTTNGRGPVQDTTWETIKELDASVNHLYSDRFKNERVPTIEEAIEGALDLGLKVILDIKDPDERAVNFLVGLFERYPALHREAIVSSFYPQLVYKLRRRNPNIVTCFIWRKNFMAYHDVEGTKPRFHNSPIRQKLAELLDPILDWSLHQYLWYIAGVSAVSIHKDFISKDYVNYWAARNIRVISWTPNNPIEKDYLMLLNVSIITDTLV